MLSQLKDSTRLVWLFLSFICLLGIGRDNPVFVAAQDGCDFSSDALTNEFGKTIPRTCINVPINDDGSTTTVLERCYYTYVPDSCIVLAEAEIASSSTPKKLPLVVDIHGMSSCPLFTAVYTGWMQKAEEECFVVVWPSGKNIENVGGTCFNLPGLLQSDDYGTVKTIPCCCLEEDSEGLPSKEPDDPLFVKMAIDSVADSFQTRNNFLSIDRARVYMAGHSNGCMTSLAVAALYSDTIAAVCCHAGALVTPFPQDYTPVPIWLAHGMRDTAVPFEGSPNFPPSGLPDTHPFRGISPVEGIGFWSMNETMDYLAHQNECLDETEFDLVRTDRTGIVGKVFQRTNCKRNATVEIIALFESGHTPYLVPPFWEDMVLRDNEKLTTIDTTALAWEFCSSHVLPSRLLEPTERGETQDLMEKDAPGGEHGTNEDDKDEEFPIITPSAPKWRWQTSRLRVLIILCLSWLAMLLVAIFSIELSCNITYCQRKSTKPLETEAVSPDLSNEEVHPEE
jgi:poly(3-hydroxybutyrate) depolymerase